MGPFGVYNLGKIQREAIHHASSVKSEAAIAGRACADLKRRRQISEFQAQVVAATGPNQSS
jgi:hypothetical protein